MATVNELLDKAADVAALSDEELAELDSQLGDAFDELKGDGETVVDEETLAGLEAVGEAIEKVRAESETRAQAQEARAARVAELDAKVRPAVEMAEGEGEQEAAEEAPAEEEAASEDEAEDKVLVAAQVEAEPVEEVSAAAKPVPLSVLKRNVPAHNKPKAAEPARPTGFIAVRENSRTLAGQEFSSFGDVATALRDAAQSLHTGTTRVARFTTNYGDNSISGKDSPAETTRKMLDAGKKFITAGGGVCGPLEPYREVPQISSAERPVAGSLPAVSGDRGGIAYLQAPTLANIGTSGGSPGQAVDVITEAEDAASATKPYQAVACTSETTAYVNMIPLQLQYGVLQRMASPEFVEATAANGLAAHARLAESTLVSAISTASTQVATQQDFGSARDLLMAVGRASARYRQRHRMSYENPLRVLLPRWVGNMIEDDNIAAAYPVGANEGPLGSVLTVDEVEAWFRRRNVEVTWMLEGATGTGEPDQTLATAQTGGTAAVSAALLGYPTVAKWYLFHEGAFVFVDGGTLDLGVIVDSTLAAGNNYRTFVETFEAAAFVGVESLAVKSTVCANGGSGGTLDPDTICDGGS